MRKPFQLVAREYDFSDELTTKGIALLTDIEYTGKIEPFEDYRFVKETLLSALKTFLPKVSKGSMDR